MQQSSTFHVYNASAGSGKTFTLVKEYLKILLTDDIHGNWDIFTFQKILAITFTNKAAGEMKERVLFNLEAFADGRLTKIYPKIIEETTLDLATIKERSKKVLDAILQNYSAFSITTIDSFTHKIIKNFAYDLGLPLNFEVEMDSVSLLNEAVDVLISKIGTDTELTNLLIAYSLDKIDDDKSWDITKELNEFSKILLNENDTDHFKNLANKSIKDFTTLKEKLNKHQQQLKEDFKSIGKHGLELIENEGLEFNDFNRSTIPKFFNDIKNKGFDFAYSNRSKTIEKAIENHQYYTKKTAEDTIASIEKIVPSINNLFENSKIIYQNFTLNKLALKSIIPLAVLNKINVELEQIKEDNNIRLNAEFNQLISQNIKDQPAPFIYERIGQRFQNYFIDEMQDTSELQWQNLIPLIDNALAQENANLLLVGDGKQAIYRWRGGKAEQFISLGSEDKNPFNITKKIKELETNFRSYSEIIKFNNTFFQHTANFLQNEGYSKIFKDGNRQKENDKQGGYISLSFLEKEEDKEIEKIKFPQKILEKILELNKEFSLNEISVLVRKKKDGIAVAKYLSENKIPVVSPDSLLLKNSEKVNFIINLLQILQNTNDEETRFEVLYFLQQHLEVDKNKHHFLKTFVKNKNSLIFEGLREYDIFFNETSFHQLPFYEKIEEIIRSFKLINSSDAYLQFFLDVVLEQQRKGTSTQEFLDFWEQKKDKLSIVAPDNANAVQIMTIHKSKGLEFPIVIFPYDLDIYKQINPKAWLNNLPEEFYGDFKELLVDSYTSIKDVGSRGVEIYNKQREELELDNFNLLYVALTRAVEQLHVITEKVTKSDGTENHNYYSGIFISYLKEKNLWKDNVLEYSFGSKERISNKENLDSTTEVHAKFISNPWQKHNIVLLASASKLWNTEQGKAIDYGNLLHEIFAKIDTSSINNILKNYKQQGLLDDSQSEIIKQKVLEVINHPKLKKYYCKENFVFNEREIIDLDGQIIIPDRLVFNNDNVVIIDYKTGKKSSDHHQQLLKYEKVLNNMNFIVNEKILIYINDKIDIVKV